MLAGLGGPQGVARLDLRRRGAGSLHRALPGAPDLAGRGRVGGRGRISHDLHRQGGDVCGAGLQGGFLDLGVEHLGPVEIPDQAAQLIAGLVGVALDALGHGVEGADQGLADQDMEVLQGGLADDVEQLGHEARAELVKRRLRRMGSGVLQLESLGLVGGQSV